MGIVLVDSVEIIILEIRFEETFLVGNVLEIIFVAINLLRIDLIECYCENGSF